MSELPLPAAFRGNDVVFLPPAEYASLLVGSCRLMWESDEQPRELPTGDVVLAANRAARDYWFWEFDPLGDLNAFLDATRIAHHDREARTLRLAAEASLRRRLEEQFDSIERSSLPPLDVEAFVRGNERERLGGLFPVEDAVLGLRAQDSYLGPFGICACGEPGCHGGYAWIEKRVCLMFIEVSAVDLSRLSTFPFQVTDAALQQFEAGDDMTRWPHARE